MSKEKKIQEYMIKQLQSPRFSGICSIPNRSSYTLNKISTDVLKNILTNKFYNGVEMNAVACMFDNILSVSVKNNKTSGLYELSTQLSKWVKKYVRLNTDSNSGFIYITHIFTDIEVIIKVPQNNMDHDNIIREYFIGISEINKLRYILPTFMYTLGAFLCPLEKDVICSKKKVDKSKKNILPFLICENIPGKNMEYMLTSNILTFPEFLGMFLQVLLSLEVAQRNIGFCHYDFHSANLMCRSINTVCKYVITLDNNIYDISALKYLPVIIDFGLSTVISRESNNETIIGSYDFEKHGMLHYMLPGVDMYKFLVYCTAYSDGSMRKDISNLFLFYENDDPYNILEDIDGVNRATNEYVKNASYSKVTTRTPLEFFEWILIHPEYSDIASRYVNKKSRDLYTPLTFSTLIGEYESLFNNSEKGKYDSIELINNCVKSEGSYILSMYFLYVLNGYINGILEKDCDIYSCVIDNEKLLKLEFSFGKNAIKSLIRIRSLVNNKISIKKMINDDLSMLFEYKNLNIPNMRKINNYSKRILNIGINNNKKRDYILNLIYKYFDSVYFFRDILLYLQFVYTIKEIKLEKQYNNFLVEFLGSIQYKIYNDNYMLINKTERWCNSLIAQQLTIA